MEETKAAPTSGIPTLKYRNEFEKVLEHYKMSDTASKLLLEIPFVLMVAASGSGRNTIIQRLLQTGNYHNVISDTTRPIRVKDGVPVEHNGVEYFFRSEEEILADLKAGEFVEAALIHNQQVSGVSVREIIKAHKAGKIAITDIEVQGCRTIMKAKPNTTAIFVLPPSFEESLARISKRSNLPKEELINRIRTTIAELDVALEDDKFVFVINDDLDEAVRTVDEIVRHGVRHENMEHIAKDLAAKLKSDAQEYLARLEA